MTFYLLCAQWFSRVWLFATPWTIANQATPSMKFSRQKYWSGLPFPSPGDSSQLRDRTWVCSIVDRFFIIWTIRKPTCSLVYLFNFIVGCFTIFISDIFVVFALKITISSLMWNNLVDSCQFNFNTVQKRLSTIPLFPLPPLQKCTSV